jgi:hypothetical protein
MDTPYLEKIISQANTTFLKLDSQANDISCDIQSLQAAVDRSASKISSIITCILSASLGFFAVALSPHVITISLVLSALFILSFRKELISNPNLVYSLGLFKKKRQAINKLHLQHNIVLDEFRFAVEQFEPTSDYQLPGLIALFKSMSPSLYQITKIPSGTITSYMQRSWNGHGKSIHCRDYRALVYAIHSLYKDNKHHLPQLVSSSSIDVSIEAALTLSEELSTPKYLSDITFIHTLGCVGLHAFQATALSQIEVTARESVALAQAKGLCLIALSDCDLDKVAENAKRVHQALFVTDASKRIQKLKLGLDEYNSCQIQEISDSHYRKVS